MITALLLGVGAVALASLFTVRRLLHLDLPATLRVVNEPRNWGPWQATLIRARPVAVIGWRINLPGLDAALVASTAA